MFRYECNVEACVIVPEQEWLVDSGRKNKGHYIKESVYHTLVLDASNLANSIVQSGTMQRQMLMGCFYKHPYLHGYILIVFFNKVCDFGSGGVLYKFIGVGSALLVQLYWAMREPRSVGRVTGTDLHAFFVQLPIYLLTADAGRSRSLKLIL